MPKWTPQQQTAIEARGGGLLVSAAAGSGKTAVLTERITSRILDREHPVPADRFLVVTFTRAAAAEMRTRIRARLRQALAENPGEPFLQRQMMLLGQAKICTMDSFFHSLVREHAPQLGLSPNLRGVDEAMLTRMTSDTLRALLEEQYLMAASGENEDFVRLTGYFGTENDRALSEEILSLYGKLRSLPFAEQWLDSQLSLYADDQITPGETGWGKYLLDRVEGLAGDAVRLMEKAVIAAGSLADKQIGEKGLATLRQELDGVRMIAELATKTDDSNWDQIASLAGSVFAGHRLTFLKTASDTVKTTVKTARDSVKELCGQIAGMMVCTAEQFREDLRAEYPVIRCLFSLVREFSRRMAAAKETAGVADFNDFAAFALRLVANPDGTPTELGKELSEQFEEIMLDEYQDTNRLQDMIFRCISKNGENLFFVGDLKQSIYRFRSANPAVFIEKKDAYFPYDGEHFPALAVLSRNFRSRLAVTQVVNAVFGCVMSRAVGDVDYDADEALYCGAEYYPPLPEEETEITLQLLDGQALPEEGEDGEEGSILLYLNEAAALAAEIRRMLDAGEQVYDKETGQMRNCRGGDFVILMRSVRGLDQLYAEAMRKAGVDAQLCTASGYFDSREVSLMVSLLQVLDNPARDVSLAAVLLSPVFPFDCDDLARLALDSKQGSLYRALLREAEGNTAHAEKAAAFVRLLDQLRRKSAVSRISTLIQYIYDQTDFIEVLSRTSGGGAREANLRLLLKYAADYESGGNSELAGFVSYLNALAEENTDFKAAIPLSEAEHAVRIMTIHRSKGLEFPIVALAACSRRFNVRELTGMTVFHPEMGFGMRRVEREKLRRFPTLAYSAIAARQKADLVSEEMRLLYVALTRAKERLILCVSEKDLGAALGRAAGMYAGGDGERISPAASARCQRYSDWILASLLRHPAMGQVREDYGVEQPGIIGMEFGLRVLRPQPEDAREEVQPDRKVNRLDAEEESAEELDRRFDWQYPFEPLTRIPAKVSVTRITHPTGKITLSAPRFLTGGDGLLSEECGGDELLLEKRQAEPGRADTGFTPAQQGTIFHRALQFADYAAGAADPDNELARLIRQEYLTPGEAETIDRQEFAAFFHSGLMERMLHAPKMWREYKFFDTIPAAEAGFPEGGTAPVLLQGIADCIFVEDGKLYLVDYKTDRVSSLKQLERRYRAQLRLYKRAILRQPLFRRMGLVYGGSCLYSTRLGSYLELT